MSQPLEMILEDAVHGALLIKTPKYVESLYSKNTAKFNMDETMMPASIHAQIGNIQKPIISFLGAYSSGKSFLINFLLESSILQSHVRPETATITVLRHISDRPEAWHGDCQVFAMREGVDPRSLDPSLIEDYGTLDDLIRFTTYSGNRHYDVVIVFLDANVLRDKIILDCPGVGTLAEIDHHGEDDRPSSKHTKLIRERELQAKAMQCSDGFVVLSSMGGGAGAFSDGNTAQVLGELSKHVERFPTVMPHGNVLLVGSQADPRRDGMRDERLLQQVARSAILKQCEALPEKLLSDLNPEALCKRIVLFFALDQSEIELGRADIARTLKRVKRTATAEELAAEAKVQFDEERGDRERTRAFEAGFKTMGEQLQMRMTDFRGSQAKSKMTQSIVYFESERDRDIRLADAKAEMEELSRQYTNQKRDRERSWEEIQAKPKGLIARAKVGAFHAFDKSLAPFENADYVKSFLTRNYTSKEQAKEFAAAAIQGELNEGLQRGMVAEIGSVEAAVLADLQTFDRQFLKRREGSLHSLNLDGRADISASELQLGSLQTMSATATFTAITAGVAGGTTVLAAAGSPLAVAALVKVLAIGVGALGAVGMGGAAAGLLAGIPVIGWFALGALGIGWALMRVFRSWQSSMASAIAASVKKSRRDADARARTAIDSVLNAAEEVLMDSLKKTKEIIDGHIAEVHEIGKGIVTSGDLRSAAEFYNQHVLVLKDAVHKIEAI